MKKQLFSLLCITTFPLWSNEVTFIKQFISSGSLVFDVGAHIGKKTNLYLTCGARVVCIEPQPDCCTTLRTKFINNRNVIIEPIGLAATPGVLKLAVSSGATTLSTFSQEWQEKSRHKKIGYVWDKSITVTVSTLDHLIKKYGVPQFCKIDVENFEYEVLQGLSQPIPYLSFEFHVETFANAQKCLDLLEQLGYRKFNFAAGEIAQLVVNTWVTKEELLPIINEYSSTYLQVEHDQLWGDIYAHYP